VPNCTENGLCPASPLKTGFDDGTPVHHTPGLFARKDAVAGACGVNAGSPQQYRSHDQALRRRPATMEVSEVEGWPRKSILQQPFIRFTLCFSRSQHGTPEALYAFGTLTIILPCVLRWSYPTFGNSTQ
jgi:hypothetical protein